MIKNKIIVSPIDSFDTLIDIKFPLTYKLATLFDTNCDPIKIIKFVITNLYQLIEESYDLEFLYRINEDWENYLSLAYSRYYASVIKPRNEIWLLSLFPPTLALEDSTYGTFFNKNTYKGIAGRITFFSYNPTLCYGENKFDNILYNSIISPKFYWYSFSYNWSIGYHVGMDIKNNLQISICEFSVVNQFIMSKRNRNSRVYPLVLYKTTRFTDCWESYLSKDLAFDYLIYEGALSEDDLINGQLNNGQHTPYSNSEGDLDELIVQYKINVENTTRYVYGPYAGYDKRMGMAFSDLSDNSSSNYLYLSNFENEYDRKNLEELLSKEINKSKT